MHAFVFAVIQALSTSTAAGAPAFAARDGGPDACEQAAPVRPSVDAGGVVDLRTRVVRLPDGVRLRVVEAGAADARPVVLLHGYSDSWFSFSRILPLLSDRYRLIALDQRGHGCSDRPEGGYGMDALADDAVAVMDALGIERATVLGHSLGSFVAQQVAARHPERVESLVLIGSAPRFAGVPAIEELAEAVRALPDPVPSGFVREFQVSTFERPLPAPFVDAVIAESMMLPTRVWRALMDGMLAMEAVAPEIAERAVPTLILWGEHDSVFGGPEQAALRGALPDAEFVAYEQTGHAPHWERPERVAEDVGAFLDRSRAAGL